MKEENTLNGKYIKVFVTNYEVEGTLQFQDNIKIILKNGDDHYVIYKTHVIMVLLREKKDSSKSVNPMSYHDAREGEEQRLQSSNKENIPPYDQMIERNQYGSMLPKTLLTSEPFDPYQKIFEDQIDLSISFNEVKPSTK
jgi:sRNA-binding regulator protein Hfq